MPSPEGPSKTANNFNLIIEVTILRKEDTDSFEKDFNNSLIFNTPPKNRIVKSDN